MKSFFSSRISKFNALMTLSALGFTSFSLPVIAAPQEVCIKTSTGEVVCGEPVQKPPINSGRPTLYKDKESDGLLFSFKGCRRSDLIVKCNFIVTSKTVKNFWMAPWLNTIVDAEGKSYPGELVDIGGTSSGQAVGAEIQPGINYSLVLTFKNIPEQLKNAPLLKTFHYELQYRNVSISN